VVRVIAITVSMPMDEYEKVQAEARVFGADRGMAHIIEGLYAISQGHVTLASLTMNPRLPEDVKDHLRSVAAALEAHRAMKEGKN
jgi:hypothetical protein